MRIRRAHSLKWLLLGFLVINAFALWNIGHFLVILFLKSQKYPLDCTNPSLAEACFQAHSFGEICIPKVNLSKPDLKRISEDNISPANAMQNHLYCYLYSKHIFQGYKGHQEGNSPEMSRQSHIKGLVDPPSALKEREEFEERHQRLVKLFMAISKKSSNTTPSDVLSYDHAIKRLPEWDDPQNSYIFYRDDKDLVDKKDVLLQRVQNSGICFMYASIMLQHCLIAKFNTTVTSPPILDINKYLRDHLDNRGIVKYLYNMGGSPIEFLRDLEYQSVCLPIELDKIDEKLMRKHGPLLLDHFGITNGPVQFGTNNNLVYTSNFTGEVTGSHVMLIVGVRPTGTSRCFLVQNWWRPYQFVEICKEAVRSANGTMHRVRLPKYYISDNLPQTNDLYSED